LYNGGVEFGYEAVPALQTPTFPYESAGRDEAGG